VVFLKECVTLKEIFRQDHILYLQNRFLNSDTSNAGYIDNFNKADSVIRNIRRIAPLAQVSQSYVDSLDAFKEEYLHCKGWSGSYKTGETLMQNTSILNAKF